VDRTRGCQGSRGCLGASERARSYPRRTLVARGDVAWLEVS
jgi:hypothetical protein